ncbi:hypothetical protein B0H19DRAFT_1263241 [Mycena capillaripes]|nr:hypothetical protein B0H19DRAFT_1263235 [Mycena capillaripes]KAJ6552796.1 hypothetical protein B0H19DRAFT_1263241 [Mycena capillaripes]
MDIDYTAFTQTQWERNCQLSAAIIVVFEYLMLFPKEVDLFWKRRWTWAKCLFIWSRYYSLGYNIGNGAVFMQSDASVDLYVIRCIVDSVKYSFPDAPNSFTGKMVEQFFIILSLRLYAIYGRSKKILAFLTAVILSEIAAMIVLFEVPKDGLVGTNNPSVNLFICADADPPHVHWMAYVPAIILVTESILLGLAVFKASQQFRAGIAGGRILPQLTKESVFFFAAIFGVHLGNLIIWMVNNLTTNELFTGYSFSIPAVLANRLLISVREQVDFTSDTVVSLRPIGFRRPIAERTENAFGNTLELSTIREAGDD